MSIAIFVITPIVLIAALAVRFAGRSQVLNVVDYTRIGRPESLHAWAGNRLLLAAGICVVLAGCSLAFPRAAPLLFGACIVAILAVAIWVATGSTRFQDAR